MTTEIAIDCKDECCSMLKPNKSKNNHNKTSLEDYRSKWTITNRVLTHIKSISNLRVLPLLCLMCPWQQQKKSELRRNNPEKGLNWFIFEKNDDGGLKRWSITFYSEQRRVTKRLSRCWVRESGVEVFHWVLLCLQFYYSDGYTFPNESFAFFSH